MFVFVFIYVGVLFIIFKFEFVGLFFIVFVDVKERFVGKEKSEYVKWWFFKVYNFMIVFCELNKIVDWGCFLGILGGVKYLVVDIVDVN